ncbi:MAG: iron donor protein CyaY [Deltaproteobacteria bacterium]|nr:iron donor protein CyaY [Deltaproteobacteria bacterium]
MDEAKFRQVVSAALRALAAQVDAIDSDDVDYKLSDGVLSVEFESGGVFVLSQQVPVRELWLSAFSRAWHFRHADGAWLERDSGERLESVLQGHFTRKLGFEVAVANPGPA